MPNLSSRVKRDVTRAAGSTFWRTYLVTSSNITVAKKQLSSAATGDLMVVACVFQTDATGLAGPTNFEIGVNGETYGIDLPLVEAVSNLGASALRQAPHAAGNADTTNDNFMTVTASVPFLLQAGDNLTYSGSVAAGTGAGVCIVAIKFERIRDNADIPDKDQVSVA